MIDLGCSALSVYLAFFLRFNFNFSILDFHKINSIVLTVLGINTLVFLFLQTFAGIIRYTSIQDSMRILTASIISTGLILGLNVLFYNFNLYFFIPFSVICIYFFCSYLFLITYRLAVKQIFDFVANGRIPKRNIIIYGAGQLGITTKKVVMNSPRSNFRVIAFIDDDISKSQKTLDGVPIYNTSNGALNDLLQEFEVEQLIIAIEDLSIERKNEIVDWSLENDIQVLSIPPASQWIHGQFKTQQIKNVKIEDLLDRDAIQIHNEVIGDQLEGKRLLITGAAGSIGAEIVRQVASFRPDLVILCDQAESPLHELELELQDEFSDIKFKSFIGDVRNRVRMLQLFETFSPNYVYHAAAYKHVPLMEFHPAEAVLNNVQGTINMAELAVRYEVEKFVMISTDKAVNPTNVMGASKRIAEIYIQSLNNYLGNSSKHNGHRHNGNKRTSHTCFITTRFGNVLGSNGSVVPRFKAQIEKGGPVTVTHPDITRFFMTIPEACQLVLEAGSMGNGGEIFVFDMGKSVKIADMADKMIRLSGLIPGKDIEIAFTGLRPGEKLYEELLNNSENTLTTYHEKILIAKVTEYDFETVSFQINDLIRCAQCQSEKEIVSKMKIIVPEFISKNSVFEELDQVLFQEVQMVQNSSL
ncbi:MAG: polysaccharide biosynthesis protein [Chitinophagaceae bacterium]